MATANPKSTASIAGHPLHPMLVAFPIALFIGGLLCDIVYALTELVAWTTAALWLIGFGIITAAIAAIAGLIDFFGEARIRKLPDAWLHAGGNVLIVLLQLYSWSARYTQGEAAVVPTGIAISMLVAGLLGFTGWKGGSMVYEHRVGVAGASDSNTAANAERSEHTIRGRTA